MVSTGTPLPLPYSSRNPYSSPKILTVLYKQIRRVNKCALEKKVTGINTYKFLGGGGEEEGGPEPTKGIRFTNGRKL